MDKPALRGLWPFVCAGEEAGLDAMTDTTVTPAPQRGRKKLFIKTYGCQMNVYDSERMRDVLTPLGYEPSGVSTSRMRSLS